jgi:hypothetical protein
VELIERGRPEQDLEGLLESPWPVTTGDEGGVDDPCRGSGQTGLPAHRCDLPGVTMSGLLPFGPGSIGEVGDEAAGRGPERKDNGRPQCTDCVRMVHVLKEVTKAVLGAVAQLRKGLAATAPKLARGRPASKAARCAARRKKRIEQKVSDLFEHRYLFVRHHLTASERKTLTRITRGQPQLRVLRGLMEEVYRLFDRRCRTATALAKLARLRARLRRFGQLRKTLKKLFAPGLEKALVFLDEKLLGSTSNAVERGNRRYRKMQKTVYRVRTRQAIEARLALDLLRERQAQGRAETTETLHKARAA